MSNKGIALEGIVRYSKRSGYPRFSTHTPQKKKKKLHSNNQKETVFKMKFKALIQTTTIIAALYKLNNNKLSKMLKLLQI